MPTIIQRLHIFLYGIVHIKGQQFMGYCVRHRCYFTDYQHMNGEIRCPTCDHQWIQERFHEQELDHEEKN